MSALLLLAGGVFALWLSTKVEAAFTDNGVWQPIAFGFLVLAGLSCLSLAVGELFA